MRHRDFVGASTVAAALRDHAGFKEPPPQDGFRGLQLLDARTIADAQMRCSTFPRLQDPAILRGKLHLQEEDGALLHVDSEAVQFRGVSADLASLRQPFALKWDNALEAEIWC